MPLLPRLHVEPLMAEHIDALRVQPAQLEVGHITREQLLSLVGEHSFAGMVGDQVVGIAGAVEMWAGRAQAWAQIGVDAGPHWPGIHGAVLRFLELAPYRRVEIAVDCAWPAAHRWARALGFVLEAERMRAFTPGGRDAALYARVKETA